MASTDIDTQANEFGPNLWLVDEMYRKFLDSPNSVSEAWQDFFSDYEPGGAVVGARLARPAAAAAPAAPPATEPVPAQTKPRTT